MIPKLNRRLALAISSSALCVFTCFLPSCSGTSSGSSYADDATLTRPLTPQQDPGTGEIGTQRAKFLVTKYLADARDLRMQGELEQALALLLRAQELTPGSNEVNQRIATIKSEINPDDPGTIQTYGQAMAQLWRIREERAKARAIDLLESGHQSMEQGNNAVAIQNAKQVLLHIEVGSDIEWGNIKQRSEDLLAQAQKAHDAALLEKQDILERETQQQLRLVEERERARHDAKVDRFLTTAIRAFEDRKFRIAEELAFQALQLEPVNHVARNLHNASIKAGRESRTDAYYAEKRREFTKMLEAAEDLKIPQTDILRTNPETWKTASQRQKQSLPTTTVDADDAAIMEQVKTKAVGKLSFTEETGDYNEVRKLVQTITSIPIIITPEAQEAIDDESLVLEMELVSSISVANFLDHMVAKSESLAWTVRNGVVEITTRALAGGNSTLISHDVRDLVFPITTFLPPTVRDMPSGDTGMSGPRIGGEADERIAYIELDTLAANIKDATGGDTYWDAEGGGMMEAVEGGYLLVTANPEMQQRVIQLLNDQRRFATTVVTIESKFLTVTQNFIQEIGVDFRGLGGSGAKGTVSTLDDITNMLDDNASRGFDNAGTGEEAGRPSAGAFFNDGGDGDVRARTENFFSQGLGRALSTTGGATASISLLDDLQVQALIRAVEKRQDIQVVNSQTITVLNNERANVAVINQTSYVRDFDIEVAQASFIADPKVDVIQDGVVLDVRPTITHDRRRVALSLQPTIAELVRPIPTFSTSLAGSTLPVTLQLPIMRVKSFATTAEVPDGGSVLLGGLREVLATERKAETPILSKIPILSFLFKQEGVSDENSSLMVLVRATITDVKDLMEDRR